jgi:hypothetical protein
LFCGSDRGDHAAVVTAKMNDVDPQAWLADVLARIASRPKARRTVAMELASRHPERYSSRLSRKWPARGLRRMLTKSQHPIRRGQHAVKMRSRSLRRTLNFGSPAGLLAAFSAALRAAS